MTDLINHNGGPPLDEQPSGRRVSVRTSWAKALFADANTPTYVMAMAWVMHWYSNSDGTGAVLSNDQFASICNISRPTVTKGKEWLRKNGYVDIKLGDGRGLKSTYTLTLPSAAKEEGSLPLSGDQEEAKGETAEHEKGEAPFRETTKGETSDQKGETRLPEKGETRLPFNQYKKPGTIQERAKTANIWSNLNPYNAEAAEDCWQDAGGMVRVSNGFRTELLAQVDNDEKRLTLTLATISANVAPNTVGIDLKKRVRSLVASFALRKHDQDDRYLKAAKENSAKSQKPVSKGRY